MKELALAIIISLLLLGAPTQAQTPQQEEAEKHLATFIFDYEGTLDELEEVMKELLAIYRTRVGSQIEGTSIVIVCEGSVQQCSPYKGEIIIAPPGTRSEQYKRTHASR